jgi:hypothetical protein
MMTAPLWAVTAGRPPQTAQVTVTNPYVLRVDKPEVLAAEPADKPTHLVLRVPGQGFRPNMRFSFTELPPAAPAPAPAGRGRGATAAGGRGRGSQASPVPAPAVAPPVPLPAPSPAAGLPLACGNPAGLVPAGRTAGETVFNSPQEILVPVHFQNPQPYVLVDLTCGGHPELSRSFLVPLTKPKPEPDPESKKKK